MAADATFVDIYIYIYIYIYCILEILNKLLLPLCMVEVGTRIVCVEIFEHCVSGFPGEALGSNKVCGKRWYDGCAHTLPWTASRLLEGWVSS